MTRLGSTSRLLAVALLAAALSWPGWLAVTASAGSPRDAAPRAPRCDGRVATIVGTSGPDTITGTPRADVVVALGGRDRVMGLGGDDRLCGGAGYDVVDGGDGDDHVLGQGDACFFDEGCFYYGDTLSGGRGRDVITGGDDRAPDDLVVRDAERGVVVDLPAGTSLGQGADTLRGIGSVRTTPYDDTVRGLRGGTDAVTGAGDDVVTIGSAGWFGTVIAGAGVDEVTAKGHGDVRLGADDDRATGGTGTLLDGGAGDDTLTLTGDGGFAEPGPGDDLVEGSTGDDEIGADNGLDPRQGDDVLRGNGGDDYLVDGDGSSTVEGGTGDDWLQVGEGDDVYDGGPGTDLIDHLQLYGDDGVRVDLAAGTSTGIGGDDAFSGFEDVTGSPQADELWGDAGPNRMDGDSGGIDLLHGRAGDDRLTVTFGAAELYGDAGDDTLRLDARTGDADGLVLDGGADRDLLALTSYFALSAPLVVDLAAGTMTGQGSAPVVGVEDVTDNDGAHTLIGDDGPNVLRGGRGADDLRGNGGPDQLLGDRGRDAADGGEGTDTCEAETVTACEG